MKIDPSRIINLYEVQSSTNAARNNTTKNESASASGNSTPNDRIEISDNGLKHKDMLISKSKLIDKADKCASEEKIQALKEKISKGEYHVSSSDIADAILNIKA